MFLTWGFGLLLAVSLLDHPRLALATGCALALLSLWTVAPAAPAPWLLQLSLCIGTPLVVERSSLPWRRWRHHAHRQLESAQGFLTAHVAELDALLTQNHRQEAQTDSLQQLYSVTKAATPALHTGELIATVARTFAQFCRFRRLRFLQVELAESTPYITAIYADCAPPAPYTPHTAPCHRVDGAILHRYLASRQAAMVDGAALGHGLDATVGWVPLMVESQWAGLLVVEGLDPSAFDRLLILAHQTSLQLARVQLYQRVEMLSVTDGLTGLFVRRHATLRMQEELARAQRLDWTAALLMLDLDCFKAQNDQYGHLVGDVVLHEIAQRIRAQVRQIDIVGRWGGEEFAVLLVDADVHEAGQVAERIRAGVAGQPIRAYDETVQQTLSIGIACCPTDGAELALLSDHADAALYQAKTHGRNRAVFYHA